ncbi:T9SS type A sorting domain-containing protein [bacterium]|nr:T9SS type A sorting domain-containing protein [bacterium]
MSFLRLNNNNFEFYYLVELTRERLKPLSRWEKLMDERTLRWLRRQGFFVEIVPRKTILKHCVYETVFSMSSRYVDYYYKSFKNTPIRRDPVTQKFEGFLFGYPSCCVQQFILHPYSPNRLRKEDQSLLFHWACDGCRITPELIGHYRTIKNRVQNRNEHRWGKRKPEIVRLRRIWQAAAAVVLSTGDLSAQCIADTTHFIPLPEDINNNGLTYAEEICLGTYNNHLDPACCIYAQLFRAMIDSLPNTVQDNRTYKVEHMMRGVVECEKCGKSINMGYMTLVNPLRHLEYNISYLGLHFMETGYFSWGPNAVGQRVNIDTLKKILFPYDPKHMLPVNEDSDGDGLTEAEEDSLWIAAANENQDMDGDGVPDGAQIAEELIRMFPSLKEKPDGIHSHIEFQPVWGLEECQICGSTCNMGTITITNPENQRVCQIPFIGLHALAHGSFAFNGTTHQNQRIDAVSLYRTMKTHMLFIQEDSDQDGLTDDEEKYFGFNPGQADTDQDGLCEGMALAISFANTLKSLPTEPNPTGPYAEFLDMDGVHLCAVCGKEIVMGVIRIHNPLLNTIDPFEISYYAFHFLQNGSFAYEGAQNGRTDPIQCSRYLNLIPTQIDPEIKEGLLTRFELKQNHPNPFNPVTVIHYRLYKKSKVELCVYDIQGRQVKVLLHGNQTPGEKQILWDGTDARNLPVGNGLYLFRLTAGAESQSKKMLLLK